MESACIPSPRVHSFHMMIRALDHGVSDSRTFRRRDNADGRNSIQSIFLVEIRQTTPYVVALRSATRVLIQRKYSRGRGRVSQEYNGSVAHVHSIFLVPDIEHEGSLLLLQPLYTALLVHEICVGTAKVINVDLLRLPFAR